jgi:hypothetical protein
MAQADGAWARPVLMSCRFGLLRTPAGYMHFAGGLVICMRALFLISVASVGYGQPTAQQPLPTIHREGVVLDATTGEPIVAAQITVQAEIPGKNAFTSTVDTDSVGGFQIDAPFAAYGRNYFWASRPGYTWKDQSPGDQRVDPSGDVYVRHIVFRLLALSTITGVVMDASGKPVSGVLIATTIVPWEKEPPQGLAVESKPITDSEGHFQVPVVPNAYFVCAFPPAGEPGQAKIAIPACFPSAPVYSAARVVTVAPGRTTEQLTIRLSEVPVYSIRGRIRFAAAHKSKDWGMEIHAESSDDYGDRPGCHSPFGPQSTLCSGPYFGDVNKDGRFVISGIPAGSYTLYASAGDGVGNEVVVCGVNRPPPKPHPVRTSELDLIVHRNRSGIDVNVVLHPD